MVSQPIYVLVVGILDLVDKELRKDNLQSIGSLRASSSEVWMNLIAGEFIGIASAVI